MAKHKCYKIRETKTGLTDKKQFLYSFDPPYKGHKYCILCINSTRGNGLETRCISSTEDESIKESKQLNVVRGQGDIDILISKIDYNEDV